MRRSMILAACLGLSAVTAAQKSASSQLFAPGDSSPVSPSTMNVITPTIVSQNEALGSATLVLDISGEDSWDLVNDPDNTILLVPLGEGAFMTGIGWNVNLTTLSGSWMSEARYLITNSAAAGLFLTPGAGAANNMPGSGSFSSGGVIDLSDSTPLPDIEILADGNLHIQLNESFDDVPDAIDANWTAGSTLTIAYEPPPPIPTVNQWGMIVLGAGLLGGVVVMTLRRKTALEHAK